ncbi:hypothetical protein Ancab_033545 [Ancistrocladus abbreviatus]
MEKFNTGISNAVKDFVKVLGTLVFDRLKLPRGVVKTTRKVAECMRYEDELSNEAEADPNFNSMVGYRYLVGAKDATTEWDLPSYRQRLKKTDHLITTEEI